MKKIVCLITFLTIFHVNAMETCDTGHDEKRGFWWYQSCPVEVEENVETDDRELPPLAPSSELMKMHPKELRVEMETRLEYALWKQTPETTVDYYRVVDVVRRKSLAFTSLTKYVMHDNPQLYARAQYPLTEAARNQRTNTRTAAVERALSTNKSDYGLIMFSQPGCQYCVSQINTLKLFQDRHHWELRVIDIKENAQASARFGVSTTPQTILIKRGTDKWETVSVGAESLPEIENGVYRAIRLMNGDISATQYILNEEEQGGFFDPELPENFMKPLNLEERSK